MIASSGVTLIWFAIALFLVGWCLWVALDGRSAAMPFSALMGFLFSSLIAQLMGVPLV